MSVEQAQFALLIAITVHAGQKDKAGLPFIEHPIGVAREFPIDSVHHVVGLLHDVVEDGPEHWLGTIRSDFGDEIADAIDAMSRRDEESYPEYILRCKANPIAAVVKVADIRNNMSRLKNITNEKDALRLSRKYTAALDVLLNE